MHWVYAVAESLRKAGGATDTIIVLDPNFPAWSKMDRVIEWDGPQMQKAMGIPFFFLVKFIMNMAMKGPMLKLAKWDTAAERELTVHNAVSSYACFTFTHTPHTHAIIEGPVVTRRRRGRQKDITIGHATTAINRTTRSVAVLCPETCTPCHCHSLTP